MPRARAQTIIPLRENPEVDKSFSLTSLTQQPSPKSSPPSFTIHRRGFANQIQAEAAPKAKKTSLENIHHGAVQSWMCRVVSISTVTLF
jgi:hypothetical protein